MQSRYQLTDKPTENQTINSFVSFCAASVSLFLHTFDQETCSLEQVCHGWCVWLLITIKLARRDQALLKLVHPDHNIEWRFSEHTWSGSAFDDTDADPTQELAEISVIGMQCDWLRYLSSVTMVGQAMLCLQYFVYIDPRLAIITESIRVAADELQHFAGVFCFILGLYALAGHTMCVIASMQSLSSATIWYRVHGTLR